MAFSRRFSWAWLVCLILLAGFLTNSISNYLVSRANVRKTIMESALPLTSDNVYSEIQRDLLRPIFISSLMANDTFLRDWVISGEEDETQITKYLNEIKAKYGTITSFFVSEKTRKYYHAHGLLKEVREDEPRDEWYFRVRAMAELFEINVDRDMANLDEMTIFINYRVFDYNGKFIGSTGVGLTVNNVNNLIKDYETRFSRQIYFTDMSGNMVLRPSNSPMLKYDTLNDIEHLQPYVNELLTERIDRVQYDRDGKSRLLNCRYISELGWFLFVEQSEDVMLAPIRKMLLLNILIAVLITVIIAWICVAAIKHFRRDLEKQNIELSRINDQKEEQGQVLKRIADDLEHANQNLSELNKEKDEFLSMAAHDLRNPLNGILGLCQLMEEDQDSVDTKEFIDDIQTSGERMLTLIRNLLDVSSIEAFQGRLVKEPTVINAIIEEARMIHRTEAQRKKITLRLEVDGTKDTVIESKGEWLAICVNNLVSNAIKYTPECGEVKIVTHMKPDSLLIEVSDTGPGFSEEEKARLFGKFVRLSAKPTGGESSTGLGLYLVKKISDRLGVEIELHSHLGDGATFILKHPLE